MPDRASTIDKSASPASLSAKHSDQEQLAEPGQDPPESPAALSWTFPGNAGQVRIARQVMTTVLGRCPATDDIVLCLSELVTNAVLHSASARPSGTVTVRTRITVGIGVYLEVSDDGGPWAPRRQADRMHGLGIVRLLAASMSISGTESTGWIITAWFNWNQAR